MTWQWVIVVISISLIYSALFITAMLVISRIAITWARGMEEAPYEAADFDRQDTLLTETKEWPKQ